MPRFTDALRGHGVAAHIERELRNALVSAVRTGRTASHRVRALLMRSEGHGWKETAVRFECAEKIAQRWAEEATRVLRDVLAE